MKELSNKLIYDDFISKTILTEDERKILDMVLLKYSIVKIAQEICMSERNVSRIIREIKDKYAYIIDGVIYDTFNPSERIMRCAWRIE